ncbi:MAG: peptide-methionine (R)-S-oxide reductase [Flavobacteriales bacterium]|nr:peptide-methionine (R)-S-oxide reductase [Flavobacteriales bacterium]|tara:strand:- start:50 stop:496 length:447 start_codon:yes stop_codon:yes gene_type:complete
MLKFVFLNINICLTLTLFSQDKIKTKDFFKDLNKEEKRVIVYKGTEPAGSGIYNNHFEYGVYVCKACNNPLFNSTSKFNSNCGWPSFDDEIKGSLKRYEDNSLFMKRTEICCANCNGHLGHVFEGEKLTKKNLRHCVNSISIRFIKKN